jgi:hypothetical protein
MNIHQFRASRRQFTKRAAYASRQWYLMEYVRDVDWRRVRLVHLYGESWCIEELWDSTFAVMSMGDYTTFKTQAEAEWYSLTQMEEQVS